MSEDDRDGPKIKLSPSWIAAALSLLAVFWQAAVVSSRVGENTRRLELLEASDRTRSDTLAQINARTARIEATLEAMRGVYRPLSEPVDTVP